MTVSLTFPPRLRLRHDLEYQAVYGARVKKTRGPLVAFSLPNSLPHYRLGLSIGKRVGNAVARNALKRHLREAFRLCQHNLPRGESSGAAVGFDLVVSAREHPPLALAEYQRLLLALADQLLKEWERRERRVEGDRADGQ